MTKTKLFAALFAVFMLLFSFASFAAEETSNITVVSATSTASTKLSSLTAQADGLFCGWFTSSEAAQALDTSLAATDGYAGTVYGAVLSMDTDSFELVGVQMRTSEPYGIRFLAKLDEEVIDTVESLNALNRKGKNGTFNPANETRTGIGYGMVLAIDTETSSALTKVYGDTVSDGMCVPGVYTYSEDDTSLTYTATVIGVANASLADKIAARPYITYADANGNEHTVYYTESGSTNSAYAASVYEVATLVSADESATDEAREAANSLLSAYTGSNYTSKSTIASFNLSSVEGSGDNDNAYLELDRTTLTALSEDNNSRYQNAYYPRITRVSDSLYLMTFNYAQEGQHLYYTTSTDGVNWGDPKVLYNANSTANTFTYTTGSLKGTEDHYYAATADHCLLADGTVLCVYSRRPCSGYEYKEYTGYSTLEVIRGTVSGSTITWSSPISVYHGQNWEPEILQRANGNVEIYWTHIAPMLYLYGFQDTMRSSGVAMISSSDNGYTWTPSVTDSSNNYAAKRVYQYSAGTVTINGSSVKFMHGQMPGVVELTNGKMMLVAETRTTSRSYHMISKAYSNAGGEWTELGISTAGPTNTVSDVFRGAAPTLARFPSGEVVLTYNYENLCYARLMNKTGTNMSTAYATNAFYCSTDTDAGFWSSSSITDSHTAMLAMAYKKYQGRAYETDSDGNVTLHNTIVLGKFRLNHTIDAVKKNMVADGNLQEWKNITDALFVGSLSNVQACYRFAYDDDYIYVAIDRTDSSNNKEDTNYVMIATSSGYIKAEISYGDYTLPTGVTGGTKNATGGRVYELAFDRAALGLTDSYIRVCPGLTDVANGIDDRINGTYITDTSTWIKINLE